MKRHKSEILRFLLAIVLPAVSLAALGIFALRVGWLQSKAGEQADLDSQAELICELMRSGARLYGFDRHGAPDDDGGPGARKDGERHGPPDDDDGGPHRPGGPLHAWKDWEIAVLPGICAEIEAKIAKGDDALAIAVEDAEGRKLYASAGFPAHAHMTGSCKLSPPLKPGKIHVVRADGGASAFANAIRLVAAGGCIVALLAASLVACGVYFLRALHAERVDAQRKTDFLDNVSHELKTPLAGIRLNAELLEQGRIADERRRLGALQAILVEADRLTKMVDKLLDFSRLEKGRYRYELETFNLGEFVGEPAELQAISAISGNRATVTIKENCATVRADKNVLRQIGVNIVTNAVKYTNGPIEIEVEGSEIRYMDRGPGLPRGDEERVFERFYRADNSLTNGVSGSGLGLSIARSLARGMGGDIVYSHRSGGGSIFIVKL